MVPRHHAKHLKTRKLEMIMSKFRAHLPQLGSRLFLADGGLETTLIFHNGLELPHFAAFDLLRNKTGREALRDYYLPYIVAARRDGFGFVLDSATWRASTDWGAKLGYAADALAAANRDAIALLVELRRSFARPEFPMVISGAIGPRGDGYVAGELMTIAAAERYHDAQIAAFASTEADMVAAYTMTNANEAAGIARAARLHAMPVAISFTLETDGRLPTGQSLVEAIRAVDRATAAYPAYYMINCAHPSHFEATLAGGGAELARLRGVRANASCRSHSELNEAADLDDGDPAELAAQYRELRRRLPQLTVLGGCCGTDYRHVSCIGEACKAAAIAA
jgi:S-methylmethionine-dependent homocysteine/selenocysteine methylase